jgi:hypothetical protein
LIPIGHFALVVLPATIEPLGPLALHVTARRRRLLDALEPLVDNLRGIRNVPRRCANGIAHFSQRGLA